MERAADCPRPAGYSGSRAEWVLKRANDFDTKARSFRCGRCEQPAAWVCLDPVCVSYNRDRVVPLCDSCDKRCHPTSSPAMHSHRRLGVVLYISMLMLHRYQKVVGLVMTASPANSRPSTPVSTRPDEVTSSQSPTTSARPSSVLSPPVSPVSSLPPSPDSTVSSTKRKRCSDDIEPEPVAKVSRTESTDRSGRFSLAADLRPIHESYGRILKRLRADRSLSVSEACIHEPFGKLTVRNYAAIAELKIADAKLYTSVLDSYMKQGDGSGTLSGFERECQQVLSGFVQQVAAMRTRGELLPSSQ
ncbi:PREDICTED: uncharacterized protein LOC109486388 [Branchiostoma belcheri]|uniref:Uncharacterized protein LOC109486388 n=1 Tax=Branchiostoma belcheri TaxID=7741 RepID=A0A6P5ARR8_BRABE|nr:PREDICTED: uncharacterized protein LOC109486388 [Branchiostoma belcheri]